MRRRSHRLPIPQQEFGFTPDTFNLIQDTAFDGDRIARERDEADRARCVADTAQGSRFSQPSTLNSQPSHD